MRSAQGASSRYSGSVSLSSCTVCVPGLEAFEVEVTVLIGDAVAAVFEIDAHVGDAMLFAAVIVA